MPTAEFAREIEVTASVERCWEVVTDVQRVASWIRIVGNVKEIERLQSYTALLEDQLGPFRLRADLDVEVTELNEPALIRLRARGEDRQVSSRISVDGTLAIEAKESGAKVAVNGSYEVTGKVATMGASMIRVKAQKMIDEFFTSLASELA